MGPELRRVLAVDGGQSAIRVRHSTGATGAEVDGVSRQEGDVVRAVAAAVIAAWRAAGSLPVDRAVLGLTTAPSGRSACQRLCAEVAAGTGAAEVWIADDAVTTHAGALSMGWGVSVTVGTGVACLAMPPDGGPSIIGGHGFLLGDEGGAFWIGREGLRAVLRAEDGRGPVTLLALAAARRFDGLADLSERIHGAARPVNAIAQFAPDVLEAAETDDGPAGSVVAEAVRELVALVRAGIAATLIPAGLADASRPGRGASGPGGAARSVPVALGGRLLSAGSILGMRLDHALDAEVPAAAHAGAQGTPLDGAMALGMAPDPGRYATLVTTWKEAR